MAGFKVPVVSLGVKGPGSVVLPGERTHPRAELQAAAGGRAHMELVTPARREAAQAGEKRLLGQRSQDGSQETWV